MKRITAFVGSARKKNTYSAVVQFLDHLQEQGDMECEIVLLSDYRLGTCRGCMLCFEKGEAFCPLQDDRDTLIEKIRLSDGIILATPNYSFHMSGIMKVFLDRFGFAFHRPRYFGKAFTSIVTQGIGGGGKIVDHFHFVGTHLGFNTLKGISITGLGQRTEKEQAKIDRALADLSKRFYARLNEPAYPTPSLFKLMLFRMARATIQHMLNDTNCDYRYFSSKGWFVSDYYYPTNLNPVKKAAGRVFDNIAPTIRSLLP
jgi:multimeric flavodoxin WrbA